MQKKQLAKLNMCNRLKNLLNGLSPATLASIPMLLIWFAKIKDLLIALEKQIQIFDAIIDGYQNNRKITRESLITAALDIAAQIQSYANTIDDMVLFTNMAYTKTFLSRCSAEDLKAITQNIANKANELLPQLADFGVTAISMTQYALTRTTFINADLKPEQANLAKQASTQAVKVALVDLMALFTKIDRAMRGARTIHPILVQDYFRARKIIALPTASYAIKGQITDAAGIPMPFVTMTCPTLDLNRKATKLGRFIIKNGKHQQHKITFSFPGYKKVTVTVTVTKGILAKIAVVMKTVEAEI